MSKHPKGRAATSGEKRAVIERIYAIWIQFPQLRLSQLLINANGGDVNLYNVEDRPLAELVESYSEKCYSP